MGRSAENCDSTTGVEIRAVDHLEFFERNGFDDIFEIAERLGQQKLRLERRNLQKAPSALSEFKREKQRKMQTRAVRAAAHHLSGRMVAVEQLEDHWLAICNARGS